MAKLLMRGISAGATYSSSNSKSPSFDSRLTRSLTLMFGYNTGAEGQAGLAGVVGPPTL